jgi:large subunit ribosomal protein L36
VKALIAGRVMDRRDGGSAVTRSEYQAVVGRSVVYGEDDTMKVRSSLKSLKNKVGSTVVRRHGRTVVVNKRHPRWKARQG